MNSRAQILHKIQQNKPEAVPLPELPLFFDKEMDAAALFQQMVETGGGQVITLPLNEIENYMLSQFPAAACIASTLPTIKGTIDLLNIQNPLQLEKVDVAIITSPLGVAENGAVWVCEKDFIHRVLPFITQHLVIILSRDSILQNMHQAYHEIKVNETGFGVFIAGPSKTADIEQSLVIGAQGARSFTVILQ